MNHALQIPEIHVRNLNLWHAYKWSHNKIPLFIDLSGICAEDRICTNRTVQWLSMGPLRPHFMARMATKRYSNIRRGLKRRVG